MSEKKKLPFWLFKKKGSSSSSDTKKDKKSSYATTKQYVEKKQNCGRYSTYVGHHIGCVQNTPQFARALMMSTRLKGRGDKATPNGPVYTTLKSKKINDALMTNEETLASLLASSDSRRSGYRYCDANA